MPVTFVEASAVQRIAERQIDRHHVRLDGEKVVCLFRSEAAKSNGQTVYGKATKVAGLHAFLAQMNEEPPEALNHEDSDELRSAPFFVLTVAKPVWDLLDTGQKDALVDHLLTSCRVEESENGTRLFTAPPAVSEYPEVIARHGMWRQELEKLVKAASEHQPSLFAPDAFADPDDNGGEGVVAAPAKKPRKKKADTE